MFQLVEEYGKPSINLFFPTLSIALVLLLFKFITKPRTGKLNLPPSPSRLPVIGNLHQLGSLPHHSLQSLVLKHGHVMMLYFGQKPILVLSSSEAAKEVMKTQDTNFANRPHTICAERLLYSNRDLAFSFYGDYWRKVRKMCVLQLFSAVRVESFKSVRKEEVDLMINKIHQSCASGSSVVNLTEINMSFTNDVVCRVAFGRKIEREGDSAKFWEMIGEFLYLLGVFNVGDFIPWLDWVNYFNGINARTKKNFKNLDCFVESLIEEHVQHRKNDESVGKATEDLIDVMLRVEKDNSLGVPFGRENIKAILVDIFAAGTDTTAATVVWALTELIKHPDIMKELQKEIREVCKEKPCVREEDLGNMTYLKMVIKETLRLHVPIPLLPRESIESTEVLGYHIPAKTRVVINAWAIARDPSSWEEPEEFRPERFKNRYLDYKEQDFAAVPFGAGRRGCPGITFAGPSMELPLANLLYHFDWTLPAGMSVEDIDVTEVFGIVASKKYPLLLAATHHSF